MAKIIDGKKHAAAIRAEVAKKAALIDCKLAVVLVGDDPASLVYINMKKRACLDVGIDFELHTLPENASQEEVLSLIDMLNGDAKVSGILVQQPFPAHLNKNIIINRLDPRKDVDCLHPENVGLAITGQGNFLPCTPEGCLELLRREGIQIEGKHAVVVGRSEIVGKPVSMMLLAHNATVTMCHSRTKNLSEVCRQADILVVAIGRPKFINSNMIKTGAIVIDVGVNRLDGNKVCGDVDYKNVFSKVSYITPVPGGVGPMTVAILMQNCVKAWELVNG